MAQVNSNESRFGGEYMVQDSDHMASNSDTSRGAKSKRQRTQGQPQQGGRSAGRRRNRR